MDCPFVYFSSTIRTPNLLVFLCSYSPHHVISNKWKIIVRRPYYHSLYIPAACGIGVWTEIHGDIFRSVYWDGFWQDKKPLIISPLHNYDKFRSNWYTVCIRTYVSHNRKQLVCQRTNCPYFLGLFTHIQSWYCRCRECQKILVDFWICFQSTWSDKHV